MLPKPRNVPPDELQNANGEAAMAKHAMDLEIDLDAGGLLEKLTRLPLSKKPFRAAEAEGPAGNSEVKKRAPVEKKSGEHLKRFTRLMTRPETMVAAEVAVARAIEDWGNPHPGPRSVPSFGKLRGSLRELELRPDRLQSVMHDTMTHSRLLWLDNLGNLRNALTGGFIALILGVILWPYAKEVMRPRDLAIEGIPTVVPLPADEVRQAAIRRAFDAFRAASGVVGKLPYVIEKERVEPRMKDFYEIRAEQDPPVASYTVSTPIRAAAEWWFLLTLTGPDGVSSMLAMKETPAGGLLDWENFVAYGAMSWEKFSALKPVTPQAMRVRLKRSDQVSADAHIETYIGFDVAPRGNSPKLKGYARKVSRSGQWLNDEKEFKEWKPVNVYLSWTQEGSGVPSGIVIGDVIRNNWLDSLQATVPTPVPVSAYKLMVPLDSKP